MLLGVVGGGPLDGWWSGGWVRRYRARVTDFDAVAQAIHDRLSRDSQWARAAHDGFMDVEEWYGRLLANLALAVGEDEVVYCSTRVEFPTQETGFVLDGRLVIVTSSTIVEGRVRAEEAKRGREPAEVGVSVSRLSLSKLEVTTWKSSDDDAAWPGQLRVQLHSASGVLELPLGRMPSKAELKELAEALPVLRASLQPAD